MNLEPFLGLNPSFANSYGFLWLSGKESACSVGDLGLIPGSGTSPGGGNGNPLQYACLKNPMEMSLASCRTWGLKESDTTARLTLSLCQFLACDLGQVIQLPLPPCLICKLGIRIRAPTDCCWEDQVSQFA